MFGEWWFWVFIAPTLAGWVIAVLVGAAALVKDEQKRRG